MGSADSKMQRLAQRVAVFAGTAFYHSTSLTESDASARFKDVPSGRESQRSVPAAAYGTWDSHWDYLHLSSEEVAGALGHKWPIEDYAAAIRKLFTDHYKFEPTSRYKSIADVDRAIAKRTDNLEEFYREGFMSYAWGGAPVRHIILVRHGQYEEQRQFEKQQEAICGRLHYELDERLQRGAYLTVDAKRVLTPLGREQAALAGQRLADVLAPALCDPTRQGSVRIHVSTLTRAKETADLIATKLPSHVVRMTPNSNLSEGAPALNVPRNWADGASVHVEGCRIEAAFRHIFYRGLPGKPRPADEVNSGTVACKQPDMGPWPDKTRHEYDIIVCHQNVIRYFFLRGLQLPPEAWLRFGGFNGSMSMLDIRPVSGSVGVNSFGDFGHMSLEQTTFGMRQGLE